MENKVKNHNVEFVLSIIFSSIALFMLYLVTIHFESLIELIGDDMEFPQAMISIYLVAAFISCSVFVISFAVGSIVTSTIILKTKRRIWGIISLCLNASFIIAIIIFALVIIYKGGLYVL